MTANCEPLFWLAAVSTPKAAITDEKRSCVFSPSLNTQTTVCGPRDKHTEELHWIQTSCLLYQAGLDWGQLLREIPDASRAAPQAFLAFCSEGFWGSSAVALVCVWWSYLGALTWCLPLNCSLQEALLFLQFKLTPKS